jgi:hypothetical protein
MGNEQSNARIASDIAERLGDMFCLMKDVGEGDIEHKFLWLLTYLWRENDVLSLITMPVLVDELERLLQAELFSHNAGVK